ncbi:MAG: efflux RND transporter periplasmic adaptor subunit [Planctomycetia bacterium]|nr:efflux RND transporter periplasmic adaptor subunit [Planctomycetia bacterium]
MIKKYPATFEPIEKVQAVARISGNIINIAFKEGDMVEKGQLLFEIEDIRYLAAVNSHKAKVAQNRAKIESHKANIRQIEAKVNYAQNDYNRNVELYEKKVHTKDIVENSLSVLEALKANLEGAKADLTATEAELEGAIADLVLAEDDLKQTKIYSMITGQTGRLTYTTGNYVTPNSQPLITVSQIDPIYVRFSISQKDFVTYFGNVEKLKQTATLKLKLADDSSYDEPGLISFIDNEINSNTDTIRVWATFKNEKHHLNPGGVASLMLVQKATEPRPAVRVSAILFDAKGYFVYVVDPKTNKAERRDIMVGIGDGEFKTVQTGLQADEIVIIDGTHKVMPGAEVKPVYREDNNK